MSIKLPIIENNLSPNPLPKAERGKDGIMGKLTGLDISREIHQNQTAFGSHNAS